MMKKQIFIFIASLLVLSGWFYWFQYRPSKIRQECSWIEHRSPAIQERSPKSEEELRKQGLLKDCSTFNTFPELCEQMNRELIEGNQAEPAKVWKEKAKKEEYEFCLHENGLK
jgi:hypothetical protein